MGLTISQLTEKTTIDPTDQFEIQEAGGGSKRVTITPAALGASPSTHTHDDRYYTEAEADALEDASILRDCLPSEAHFEALAAKRRDDYAGSGFVEWGNHFSSASYPNINEGMWQHAGNPNTFVLGDGQSPTGVSKTEAPYVCVNGYIVRVDRDVTNNAAQTRVLLPDAPATSSLLDRQDLVFLECFHEDISEKDFVYPYGNTQFGATSYSCPDGTSLTCANGAFTGYGTYSLFGNWQSANDLIGKGIVWSTMTEAQKRSFASDPENNLYYTPDNKIVQVRYRVRVVEGLGSDWGNPFKATISSVAYYGDSSNERLKAKGKRVSILSDVGVYNDGSSNYWNTKATVAEEFEDTCGTYVALNSGGGKDISTAHNGLCFVIPIALDQRRNMGAFLNEGWTGTTASGMNSNGSAKFLIPVGEGGSGTAKFWYQLTVDEKAVIKTGDVVENCFTYASGGSIASGVSGRPDGLYYDAIYEHDVKDLRNSSHKVTDFKRCLEREFNKTVAGETRGWEKSNKTVLAAQNPISAGTTTRLNYTGIGSYTAIGDTLQVIQSGTPKKAMVTAVSADYVDFEASPGSTFASTATGDVFCLSGPRDYWSK
jgi:hypothetical protein